MVISETTVRPMAAFWHPCHRGICESFHIRRGGRTSTDGLLRVAEQMPWLIHQSDPAFKYPKRELCGVEWRLYD